MTFESPLWLWALLALPLVLLCEAWARRRDQERVARLVARALWPRVLRLPAPRWRVVRLSLVTLGVAGIVLALARPQWGIVREKVEREGVDVVLALDTSGSMATEDVAPSRFFLARAALANLITRLEGDRIGLLAFEGEAYPLAPLTLDADAVGLFLDTLEPGVVPAAGTSIGVGLAKGLDMFVDKERSNKVLVLISDGEDLEGDVEAAVARAKAAGVVVHTVGIGTERGQPVPDIDRDGKRIGFKKDEAGGAVISRLHSDTLEKMAQGTGGRYFRITPLDTSLSALASAIEGMEHKALAREYSYRKKERFQVPLGVGLCSLALALLLPLPRLRWRRSRPLATAAGMLFGLLVLAPPARADEPRLVDEVLLRPRRTTATGREQYELGNHKGALEAFEQAAGQRPDDAQAKFNLAAGLYKNGKYDEAAAILRALGTDARAPLLAEARYNLGNTLYQKQDFPGAIGAYRDALRAAPDDADTRRNLELALRALQKQQEQQKQQQDDKDKQDKKDQKDQKDQDQKQDKPQDQKGDQKPKPDPSQQQKQDQRPKTEEQKEQERFQKEAGMPKERALQLLQALQQNEKDQQKKQIAARKVTKKGVKDW